MQTPWLYNQPPFRPSSRVYVSAYVHDDDDGGGGDDDGVVVVHVWVSPPFSTSLPARLFRPQLLLCSAKPFSPTGWDV